MGAGREVCRLIEGLYKHGCVIFDFRLFVLL